MTTMSIKTFLNVVPNLPARTSIMLRGDTGIGKSRLVRNVAHRLGFKQEDVIDRRLSQMTEGDVIGLPSIEGGVTRFNPPDWFKSACESPKILFLDELNRAVQEVMQVAFQVVLDKELNGWKLHPQTRVFTAINVGASYTVNEVDPALLDRFFVVDVEPTVNDWVEWARSTDPIVGGNISPTIINFMLQHGETWLFAEKNQHPGRKTTSPRSWEGLNAAIVNAKIDDKPHDAMFYPMCLGFIGTEATIAFHGFAKEIEHITGEDIIERYQKVEDKIKRFKQDQTLAAIDAASEYVISKLNNLDDNQGKNLTSFMEVLQDELRLTFWMKLTAKGADKLPLLKDVHKSTSRLVLKAFGMEPGAENINKMPNISGIDMSKFNPKNNVEAQAST